MGHSEHSSSGRVFAYCHDSVGVGHLARTLTICDRLSETFPRSTFLLATGTPYISLFPHPARLDYIKLPALTKGIDATYGPKYLSIPTDDLIRCRAGLLRQAVLQFCPDVFLIDKAPLGVCRELVPALEWIHRYRPQTRVVFGMRDIEDAPEATIDQWAQAGVMNMLETHFDEIWVYGMRSLFDVATEYRLPESVQKKMRFMGYVARESCRHPPKNLGDSRSVLVTVGGGTDGDSLIDHYLTCAVVRVWDMGLRSTIVGGPDLPCEARRSLRARALGAQGVEWIDFEPCLNCRIRDAALVVSMGGYNTLCHIARNSAPALVVPRAKPRLEQTMRANLWQQHGAVTVADSTTLTAARLADQVCSMLRSGWRPSDDGLDLGGLERICDRFECYWPLETRRAAVVHV